MYKCVGYMINIVLTFYVSYIIHDKRAEQGRLKNVAENLTLKAGNKKIKSWFCGIYGTRFLKLWKAQWDFLVQI